MKNNNSKQGQYTTYERDGQLVLALNSEMLIPANAPVRLLSDQLEELDYTELYNAYSPTGRKSAVEPRVLFVEKRLSKVKEKLETLTGEASLSKAAT